MAQSLDCNEINNNPLLQDSFMSSSLPTGFTSGRKQVRRPTKKSELFKATESKKEKKDRMMKDLIDN